MQKKSALKTSSTILMGFFLLMSLNIPRLALAARVGEILLQGNSKTKDYIILNELGFKPSDEISKKDIDEARRRLRNLGIFSDVQLKVQRKSERLKIKVKVKERWTTIPVFKATSGGGTTLLTVGVLDPSIAGHFVEAGGLYQKLGETDSGFVWFKNPRLFGRRQGLELHLWRDNRLRAKFDPLLDEPVINNGFLQTRDRIFAGYRYEFSNYFSTRLTYEYNDDVFSNRLVPEGADPLVGSEKLPPSTQFHFAGVDFDYGQTNIDSYLIQGTQWNVQYRHAFASNSGVKDFDEFRISYRYYKTLFSDHTFAQRLSVGVTSTKVLQYWYYFGGLAAIRGFADNRFSGRLHWLSNSEYRWPFFKRDWLVLQSNIFLDLVTTAESAISDLADLTGASAGLGIRIILPKIYRFTFRVDYAQPLRKEDNNSISFGVQQFF